MTQFTSRVFLAFSLLSLALITRGAHAEGLLDFADPCIDAHKKFSSTKVALQTRADAVIKEWDEKKEPPGEIRGLYVEAVRKGSLQGWLANDAVKLLIANLKPTNPNFDEEGFFYSSVYPTVISTEREAELVRTLFQADYRASIRPKFLEDRRSLDMKIDEQKVEMDKSCDSDVFNQVIRSSFGGALLIVSNNSISAKGEIGEVAKLVRATSGISLGDIQKYGILGGPNSEIRKISAAAGIGKNSEITKGLKNLTDTLSSYQWKLPKVPNPPAPIVTIGRNRVCVPWC